MIQCCMPKQLWFLLLILSFNFSKGAIVFVSSDGTDTEQCGSAESPCGSVSFAVQQANDGDTIDIGPGTYKGSQIEISKNVNIEGSGSNLTFLDCGSSSPSQPWSIRCSDSCCSISGVSIKNCNSTENTEWQAYGIRALAIDISVPQNLNCMLELTDIVISEVFINCSLPSCDPPSPAIYLSSGIHSKPNVSLNEIRIEHNLITSPSGIPQPLIKILHFESVSVSNCTFNDNQITSYDIDGGILSFMNCDYVWINNVNIHNNYMDAAAYFAGGLVRAENGKNITIEMAQFSSNRYWVPDMSSGYVFTVVDYNYFNCRAISITSNYIQSNGTVVSASGQSSGLITIIVTSVNWSNIEFIGNYFDLTPVNTIGILGTVFPYTSMKIPILANLSNIYVADNYIRSQKTIAAGMFMFMMDVFCQNATWHNNTLDVMSDGSPENYISGALLCTYGVVVQIENVFVTNNTVRAPSFFGNFFHIAVSPLRDEITISNMHFGHNFIESAYVAQGLLLNAVNCQSVYLEHISVYSNNFKFSGAMNGFFTVSTTAKKSAFTANNMTFDYNNFEKAIFYSEVNQAKGQGILYTLFGISNVTIEQNTIKNSVYTFDPIQGMLMVVQNSQYVVISSVYMSNETVELPDEISTQSTSLIRIANGKNVIFSNSTFSKVQLSGNDIFGIVQIASLDFASLTNLIISENFFQGAVLNGSAIHISDVSNVEFSDSWIINNTNIGGNPRSVLALAGLLEFRAINILVTSTVILYSSDCAKKSPESGSVININDVVETTILNCTFSGNFASGGDGFAPQITGVAISWIVQSAVAIPCSFSVTSSKFIQNTAAPGLQYLQSRRAGGAIYIFSENIESTVSMVDSVFSENGFFGNGPVSGSTSLFGGAVYATAPIISFINCSFVNNTITSPVNPRNVDKCVGGAVHISQVGFLNFTDCLFEENSVIGTSLFAFGGAIDILQAQEDIFVNIQRCKFIGNIVKGFRGGGGAINIRGTNESELVVTKTTWLRNLVGNIPNYEHRSVLEGGALLCENMKAARMQNNHFAANTVQSESGDALDAQLMEIYGGALALRVVETLNVAESTFFNNSIVSRYPGNVFGGAASITLVSNSKFENVSFSRNMANVIDVLSHSEGSIAYGCFGGGVIVRSRERTPVMSSANISYFVEMTNVYLNENLCYGQSVAEGGGVALLHDGEAELSNVRFRGNSVKIDKGSSSFQGSTGGGLYSEIHYGTSLTNVTFEANWADIGSAISAELLPVVIEDVNFTSNVATLYGTVYCPIPSSKSQNEVCSAGTFTNNSANLFGPMCASYITGINCVIYNNISHGNNGESVTHVYNGQLISMSFYMYDQFSNLMIGESFKLTINTDDRTYFRSNEVNRWISMNVSNGEFLLRGAQVFGQPGELLDTDFTGFSAERALFGRNVTTTLSYFIHNCAPNYYFDENMGECVRCEGLFYNFRQEQCSLCPSGSLIHKIRCINSTGPYNFEISRGFWPSPSLENPLELLWCPVQAACGYYSCRYFGNGINQTKWEISCSNTLENSPCTTGYVDRVCSRCLCEDREGCYFRTSDGYCNKCADVPGRPWLPPLIYIVMTLITILYYALPQTSITTRLTTVLLTYLQLSVPLLEGSVLSTVAALFGIISNAGSSILDIVPALQCSLPVLRSPIGAFLSTMAWPLVVIFPGACFCIVTWNFLYIIYKRKKEKEKTKLRMSNIMESEEWEDNDSTGFSTTTFDACVQAGYYIAFTSYLNWVITILEVWNCTLFDSEFTYMRFNPWIPCSFTDTEYCALFVLSIVFSVLYLIGIPSVLVWTLARKKSMNQYKFERRMGWFTYCYKPKYSNFEFVNMLEKLTFAMCVTLFPDSNVFSQSGPVWAICFFSSITYILHPYKERIVNTFEIISSLGLLVLYSTSVYTKVYSLFDWATLVFVGFVFLLNLGLILVLSVIIVRAYWKCYGKTAIDTIKVVAVKLYKLFRKCCCSCC